MKIPARAFSSLVCIGALVCFGGAARASLFSFSQPDAKLGEVKRTDLVQQVTVAGTVLPNRRAMFTPPDNGYVKRLFVTVGQRVSVGMPIITMSSTLHGEDDQRPMRAPFSGTVVQVLRTEGEYVEKGKDGDGLVRIDDLSRLFILSDVPESDVEKIHLGQEAVLQISGIPGRTYRGLVREIFLSAREKKEWNRATDRVEFPIRIEVLDKDDLLHPGMSAIVDIITDKRVKVLALPHEYIQKSNGHYFVTTEDGLRHDITVGMQNEEMFEIKSGVDENAKVRMVDFISLARSKDREPAQERKN